MSSENPIKRNRGGQPGNKNAKGNKGNRTQNRHRFAAGNKLSKGAPIGNTNARKRKTLRGYVAQQYGNITEVSAWLLEHGSELDALPDDEGRDAALYKAMRDDIQLDTVNAESVLTPDDSFPDNRDQAA